MIQGIDHIAIAVRSLEEEIPRYRDLLGLEFLGTETVPDQKVKVALFRCGSSFIELLEPLSTASPISSFIEKRGVGLHHVALNVEDIRGQIGALRSHGARMLDEEPRKGAHDAQIAFAHPKSFGGVLIELKEKPSK